MRTPKICTCVISIATRTWKCRCHQRFSISTWSLSFCRKNVTIKSFCPSIIQSVQKTYLYHFTKMPENNRNRRARRARPPTVDASLDLVPYTRRSCATNAAKRIRNIASSEELPDHVFSDPEEGSSSTTRKRKVGAVIDISDDVSTETPTPKTSAQDTPTSVQTTVAVLEEISTPDVTRANVSLSNFF